MPNGEPGILPVGRPSGQEVATLRAMDMPVPSPSRRLRRVGLLAGAFLLVASGCALDSPQEAPTSTESPQLPGVAVPLPELADPLLLNDVGGFSGVARLEMGSNCTGTLIDTGVDEGPAYLLTNGHCTGDVGRPIGTVTTNEDWFGHGFLLDTVDNATPLVVEAQALEYSTMRGRDIAIVRLAETLGYLRSLGIQPVEIIAEEPAAGTAVRNIAAPVQDIAPDEWVLRSGGCTLSHQSDLIELHWLWTGSWATDCQGVRQGSSGSPLFTVDDAGGPEAIAAIINTTTWASTAANGGLCFLNRPCELGTDGPTMVEETSYAVSVAGVGNCFDEAGAFRLGGTCPLEEASLWANSGGGIYRGGNEADATGREPAVGLVLNPALGPSADVRTALVPLRDGATCRAPEIYADAATIEVFPVEHDWDPGVNLPVTLPTVEGHYVFCAVAGEDYGGSVAVLFEVDRTPPMFPAGADVHELGGGNISVQPFLNPPEISTVRFAWREGDVACPATQEFQDFFIVPLVLKAHELPATYCIYALDQAGNTTDVTRMSLTSR